MGLVGFVPVEADTGVDFERHIERRGRGHQAGNCIAAMIHFGAVHFKYEFGALIAVRSAYWRTLALRALMSGR